MLHRTDVKSSRTARGFTITELLVVIVIIAILMTIGIGGWRALVGTNSVEGAENVVKATLGRAREEAMGQRLLRGVVFYKVQEQVFMAFVQQSNPNSFPGELDLLPDSDIMAIQAGVGALFPGSSGYQLPGVILFDGYGSIFVRSFQIRSDGKLGQKMQLAADFAGYTHISFVLFDNGLYERTALTERPKWLETKGRPLFVNRYSGTLVRGQS